MVACFYWQPGIVVRILHVVGYMVVFTSYPVYGVLLLFQYVWGDGIQFFRAFLRVGESR